MRLRSTLLSIGVLVVMIVGSACGDASSDGPLDASGEGSGYSQFIDAGVPFSIGLPLIGNLGEKDGVVEEVRLVGVTGPLEILGLRTRPFPDDSDSLLSFGMHGFPPTEEPSYDPAKANVVIGSPNLTPAGTPEDVLQLIIGVKATAPGIAANRGVEVTYRVGGKRYREVWDDSFALCSPEAAFVGRQDACPPQDFEYDDRVVDVPFA